MKSINDFNTVIISVKNAAVPSLCFHFAWW